MIVDKKTFKPIRTIGLVLMFGSCFNLMLLITGWNEIHFSFGGRIFIIGIALWQLVTSIGILLRTPWGFLS